MNVTEAPKEGTQTYTAKVGIYHWEDLSVCVSYFKSYTQEGYALLKKVRHNTICVGFHYQDFDLQQQKIYIYDWYLHLELHITQTDIKLLQ